MLLAALLLATADPAPVTPPSTTTAEVPPAHSEKCKIVVFNLVGRALAKGEEELPAILTEALAGEVGPSSSCDVTTQADIVSMLDYEKQKAVCTDGSDSCLSEIGQAFGADRVVAGTISKLASEYIVSAKLMNVKKGSVEQRAEQTVSSSAELRLAAKNVGRRLFGATDLAVDTHVAVAPVAPPSSGGGALLWTGVALAGVGAVAGIVGGALAFVADGQLAQPKAKDKDGIEQTGLIELGVAGAGVVVLVVGGVLAGVGM